MAYLVLKMMWSPESVSTISEVISPTFRLKEASSNGFCIWPRLNGPKSPPRLAELQSEYFWANSANVASPFSISLLYLKRISRASSLDLVIFSSRQELGRRDPLCLTNRCEQTISAVSWVAAAVGTSHWDSFVYILTKNWKEKIIWLMCFHCHFFEFHKNLQISLNLLTIIG